MFCICALRGRGAGKGRGSPSSQPGPPGGGGGGPAASPGQAWRPSVGPSAGGSEAFSPGRVERAGGLSGRQRGTLRTRPAAPPAGRSPRRGRRLRLLRRPQPDSLPPPQPQRPLGIPSPARASATLLPHSPRERTSERRSLQPSLP